MKAILQEFQGEEDFLLRNLCEKFSITHFDVQSCLLDSRYERTKVETIEVNDSRNENQTEKDTFSSHHDTADINCKRHHNIDCFSSSTSANTDYGSIISSFATPTVMVKRASQTSTFSSISEISERFRNCKKYNYEAGNEEHKEIRPNIQSSARTCISHDERHNQRHSAVQTTGKRCEDTPLSNQEMLLVGREVERKLSSGENGQRSKDSSLALCDSGTDDTTKSSFQRHGGQAFEEQKPDWVEMYDDTSGRLYYYNSQELCSSWSPPESFQALRPNTYGPLATITVTTSTSALPGRVQDSDRNSERRRDSTGYTCNSSCSPTIESLQTADMTSEKARPVSSIDGQSLSRSGERRRLRANIKEERRLQMKERRDFYLARDAIQGPRPSRDGVAVDQGQRYMMPSSRALEACTDAGVRLSRTFSKFLIGMLLMT